LGDTVVTALTKPDIVTVYTRTAGHYDLWASLTESRARRRVADVLAIRDGEAILEVAVGTGLLFVELLKRNPHGRTVGVDLTDAMLQQARRKAEHTHSGSWELQVGDAYALQFPDGSFDAIVNCYMFDLVPDADFARVLREFYRVLKPGGRLVLATLAPTGHPMYRLWEFLYRRNPKWVGGCRGVHISDAAQRAGFEIKSSEKVTQLMMVTEVLSATKAVQSRLLAEPLET
jgi:ubiquinone/menaquinone biosynthesis C-methylase UbiE